MRQVLIVASSAIARAGLTALLTEQSDQWQVFSLPSLQDWAPTTQPPDVLLLDLSHQGSDLSAELLRAIEDFQAPVVALLESSAEANSTELLKAGVHGLLLQDATPAELVAALEAAANGLITLQADLMEGLLRDSSPRSLAETPSQALTQREIEVLTLLAEGMGNKAIARQLNISEHTVKFHISALFAKLNASSRTEAVMIGARLGLILL